MSSSPLATSIPFPSAVDPSASTSPSPTTCSSTLASLPNAPSPTTSPCVTPRPSPVVISCSNPSDAQQTLEEKREALLSLKKQKEQLGQAKRIANPAKGKGPVNCVLGGTNPKALGGAGGEGLQPWVVERGKGAHGGVEGRIRPLEHSSPGPISLSPSSTLTDESRFSSYHGLSSLYTTDPFGFTWSSSTPYDFALACSSNPILASRARPQTLVAGEGERPWVGPFAQKGEAWSAPASPSAPLPSFMSSHPPRPTSGGASTLSSLMSPPNFQMRDVWDPDTEAELVRRAKLEKRRCRSLEVSAEDLASGREGGDGGGGGTGEFGMPNGAGGRSAAGTRGRIFGRSRKESPESSSSSSSSSLVNDRPGSALYAPSPLRSASTPDLGTYSPHCLQPTSKAALKADAIARKSKEKEAKAAFEQLKRDRVAEERVRLETLRGGVEAGIREAEKRRKEDENRRRKEDEKRRRKEEGMAKSMTVAGTSKTVGAGGAETASKRKSWFGGWGGGEGPLAGSIGANSSRSAKGRRSSDVRNGMSSVGRRESSASPTLAIPEEFITAPTSPSSSTASPALGIVSPPLVTPPTSSPPKQQSNTSMANGGRDPPMMQSFGGYTRNLETVPASPIDESPARPAVTAVTAEPAASHSTLEMPVVPLSSPTVSGSDLSSDTTAISTSVSMSITSEYTSPPLSMRVPRDSVSTDEMESSFPSTPDDEEQPPAAQHHQPQQKMWLPSSVGVSGDVPEVASAAAAQELASNSSLLIRGGAPLPVLGARAVTMTGLGLVPPPRPAGGDRESFVTRPSPIDGFLVSSPIHASKYAPAPTASPVRTPDSQTIAARAPQTVSPQTIIGSAWPPTAESKASDLSSSGSSTPSASKKRRTALSMFFAGAGGWMKDKQKDKATSPPIPLAEAQGLAVGAGVLRLKKAGPPVVAPTSQPKKGNRKSMLGTFTSRGYLAKILSNDEVITPTVPPNAKGEKAASPGLFSTLRQRSHTSSEGKSSLSPLAPKRGQVFTSSEDPPSPLPDGFIALSSSPVPEPPLKDSVEAPSRTSSRIVPSTNLEPVSPPPKVPLLPSPFNSSELAFAGKQAELPLPPLPKTSTDSSSPGMSIVPLSPDRSSRKVAPTLQSDSDLKHNSISSTAWSAPPSSLPLPSSPFPGQAVQEPSIFSQHNSPSAEPSSRQSSGSYFVLAPPPPLDAGPLQILSKDGSHSLSTEPVETEAREPFLEGRGRAGSVTSYIGSEQCPTVPTSRGRSPSGSVRKA